MNYQLTRQFNLFFESCSGAFGEIEKSLANLRKLLPWSRTPKFGKGNWNSECMTKFRDIRTGRDRIPTDPNRPTAVRRLFDGLKPLGCDEIRYRGECYELACKEQAEHFEKLKNLKIGEIYEPRSNFYTSSSKDYAFSYTEGNSMRWLNKEKGLGNVYYEILIPEQAKVIEARGGNQVEAVLDDRSRYKIIDKIFYDDTLKIKCELLQ